MTIIVSGRTFDHRDFLKSLGGLWDATARHWTLPDHTPAHHLDRLRKMPGIGVSTGQPKPRETPNNIADIVDRVVERHQQRQGPQQNGPISFHGNDESWLGKMDRHPTAFFGFSTFDAMIDFVENTPTNIRAERQNNRNSGWDRDMPDWYGTPNMSEAINTARNGWKNGVELVKRASDMIAVEHAQARVRAYRPAGGKVNVGRMLSGSPLHMQSRPRRDGRNVITLHVDVWMASMIKSESAIIRAACVAAISDILESRGYSCEIIAVGSAYTSSLRCQTATVIKQAGEALNLNNTVFALGHPSMLRRFCFALAAHEERLRSFWSSMGRQERAFVDCEPGQFYINKLEGNLTGTFDEKVHQCFSKIIPENLPITLDGAE